MADAPARLAPRYSLTRSQNVPCMQSPPDLRLASLSRRLFSYLCCAAAEYLHQFPGEQNTLNDAILTNTSFASCVHVAPNADLYAQPGRYAPRLLLSPPLVVAEELRMRLETACTPQASHVSLLSHAGMPATTRGSTRTRSASSSTPTGRARSTLSEVCYRRSNSDPLHVPDSC